MLGNEFQSTPVIADGRTSRSSQQDEQRSGFQSTPVITDGRTTLGFDRSAGPNCFNPRPSLLTGELPGLLRIPPHSIVSIHARHY